jgi:hypothetical protein
MHLLHDLFDIENHVLCIQMHLNELLFFEQTLFFEQIMFCTFRGQVCMNLSYCVIHSYGVDPTKVLSTKHYTACLHPLSCWL